MVYFHPPKVPTHNSYKIISKAEKVFNLKIKSNKSNNNSLDYITIGYMYIIFTTYIVMFSYFVIEFCIILYNIFISK